MNFNTKIICFWHSFRTISLDLIISQLFEMFPNSLISRKPNLLSSYLNPTILLIILILLSQAQKSHIIIYSSSQAL